MGWPVALCRSLLLHGAFAGIAWAWAWGWMVPKTPSKTADPAVFQVQTVVPEASGAGFQKKRNSVSQKTVSETIAEQKVSAADSAPPKAGSNLGTAFTQPKQSYLESIHDRIDSVLEFPLSFKRRGFEGSVTVSLIIKKSGELASATLLKASPHSELDDLALKAVRDAAPFSPFKPEHFGLSAEENLTLRLPIEFRLGPSRHSTP